jgi:hypothetical protein
VDWGSNGGQLKTENNEAGLLVYSFLIDVFFSAITTLIGGLAGLIKEAVGLIMNLVDIAKDCSGAGAVLLSWATLVLAVAMFALGVLLTLSFGWLVAVLLGSLINSIIGAIFGGVFIPVVCKK